MNGMEFKTSEEIEKELDEMLNKKPDYVLMFALLVCLVGGVLLIIYL